MSDSALYIGLATGFCDSLTSFSSFLRDAFLALPSNLPNPNPTIVSPASTSHPLPRNGGYSFMALIAVILLTLSLTLSTLKFGAHLAIGLDSLTPTLSFRLLHKTLDRLTLFLGPATWLTAIFSRCSCPTATPGVVKPCSLPFSPLSVAWCASARRYI